MSKETRVGIKKFLAKNVIACAALGFIALSTFASSPFAITYSSGNSSKEDSFKKGQLCDVNKLGHICRDIAKRYKNVSCGVEVGTKHCILYATQSKGTITHSKKIKNKKD